MADHVRVEMDHDAERLVARFQRLAPEVRAGVQRGLARSLLVMETRVRQGTGVRWRRGMAGLAGRLTSYARPDAGLGIEAAIGFRRTRGFPYELAQEFGARAAPGKAMAIPISPLARRMSDRGQGPRDWPRTGAGALFRPRNARVLMQSTGLRTKPILHYVLTKSIPPRLRFIRTVRDNRSLIEQGVLQGAREGAARS